MSSRVQIEEYLQRLKKKDFRLDLGPMREACLLLNNPQESYTTVHIAGTNGKGSTAAFLSSLLQSAGYKVGLITSPHLIELTERIQIDRQNISWEALWEVLQNIEHFLPETDYLSTFEMITLAGFEYFSKMGVDIAVVEVGMGGRCDATNVLKSQTAILTSISLDHENYLGDSLIKIAEEKCGILKPEMTVVSAPQVEEVALVIEKKCDAVGSGLVWADPNDITVPLDLKGEHQKTNAACALTAAKILLSDETVEERGLQALAKTSWPGRLQVLSEKPLVLADGAHNVAGIHALKKYLEENHSDKNIHFLIGVLKDKNWSRMFHPLFDLAASFSTVTPPSERALDAETLAGTLKESGKPVFPFNKPIPDVLRELLPRLTPQDLVVATGSLYMVGEVMSGLR